jgi:TPR repeat protein
MPSANEAQRADSEEANIIPADLLRKPLKSGVKFIGEECHMNIKELRLITLTLVTLALCGCVGLNPNVGTRTADDAYMRGDCAKAIDIYEQNAQKGQPWAQTRLGIVYYEGKCRPRDYVKAIPWLKKAATYEAKTDWEMGKEFSTGPAGFFNTRTSSSNASTLLAQMYSQGAGVEGDLVTAWLWANHAVLLAYDIDKPDREKRRAVVELKMSTAELQRAKASAQSWPPRS